MTGAANESFSLKKGRIFTIFVVVVLFFIGTYQTLSGSKGIVTAQVDSEHLGVCGTYGDAVFIKLTDIKDILFTDSFDFGTSIADASTGNTVSGLYSCAAYGQYTVHAYLDVSSYIVVSHSDGILVFNCATDSLTENIYNQLLQAVG